MPSKKSIEAGRTTRWRDGEYFQCSLVDLTAIGNDGYKPDVDLSDVSEDLEHELDFLDTAFLCDYDTSLLEEQLESVCKRHQNVCICQQTNELAWSHLIMSDNSSSDSNKMATVPAGKEKTKSVKKFRLGKGLGSKLIRWFSERKVSVDKTSSILVCNMAASDQLRWSCAF